METYSVKQGFGPFQWFVVQDSTGDQISEHTSRNDAELAKFAAECAF